MGRFSLASVWNSAFRSDYESQWTRVLCVLFFFSGFPALIYQLTWQLFRVFGVNIESVTMVVTAIMLGLGLGSLLGGVLSKRKLCPCCRSSPPSNCWEVPSAWCRSVFSTKLARLPRAFSCLWRPPTP